MNTVVLMQDSSEVVRYDKPGIPLFIATRNLSSYPGKKAVCHWHEDIELVFISEGRMHYYVNGNCLLLKKGDALIVGSRQMHYGYSFEQQECTFTCMVFHPSLFTGNQALFQTYILPFLEQRAFEYLLFSKEESSVCPVPELLGRIAALKEAKPLGYEIEVIGLMHILWARLLSGSQAFLSPRPQEKDQELSLQKTMVSYIYQNYAKKLSLDDIASSAHVCRSKCCQIFRRYLRQSPINFLNAYRLKVSCGLLLDTSASVTEIAFSCGFNHLSYYSRLFFQVYGCTPSQYRRQKKEPPAFC